MLSGAWLTLCELLLVLGGVERHHHTALPLLLLLPLLLPLFLLLPTPLPLPSPTLPSPSALHHPSPSSTPPTSLPLVQQPERVHDPRLSSILQLVLQSDHHLAHELQRVMRHVCEAEARVALDLLLQPGHLLRHRAALRRHGRDVVHQHTQAQLRLLDVHVRLLDGSRQLLRLLPRSQHHRHQLPTLPPQHRHLPLPHARAQPPRTALRLPASQHILQPRALDAQHAHVLPPLPERGVHGLSLPLAYGDDQRLAVAACVAVVVVDLRGDALKVHEQRVLAALEGLDLLEEGGVGGQVGGGGGGGGGVEG